MPGNLKPDQSRLTTLLTDTVILLCKNGLNFQSSLRIEGLLGITIDDSDVFIVHLNETVAGVSSDGVGFQGAAIFGDAGEKQNSQLGDGGIVTQVTRMNSASSKETERLLSNDTAMTDRDETRKRSSFPSKDVARSSDAGQVETHGLTETEICIKEEKVDDEEAYVAEDVGHQYDHNSSEAHPVKMARRERQSYRWIRGVGGTPRRRRDYQGSETSATFSRNEGTLEVQNRMNVDEWKNVEASVLSSLSGEAAEDESSNWQNYVWDGRSFPSADLITSPLSRLQSQSMAVSMVTGGCVALDGIGNDMPHHDLHHSDMSHDDSSRNDTTGHHPYGLVKPFACPVVGCTRRFFHRNNVYRHRKQKHGTNVLCRRL